MNRRRAGIKNFPALFIGLVIAFILLEILIRLFPHKFLSYLLDKEKNFFKYKEDKKLGYLIAPNQKALWGKDCLKIYPIYTNSLGFRDNEWLKDAEFKIAVLGDSYMLAVTVSEGDDTSSILEKLLNKEVLNTGVGGFGTVAELFIYKEYLKSIKPNIVILFFCTGNDIIDNSCELSKLNFRINRISQPCGHIWDGNVKIDTNYESRRMPESQIKEILKKYCLSCNVIYKSLNKFLGMRYYFKEMNSYIYMPPQIKSWQAAWGITEKTLVDLKKEVESQKAKLIVVTVPDYIRVSKNWEVEIKRESGMLKIPKDFDPFYPVKKLRTICQRNDLLCLELESEFLNYRDKFNLKYPYFSYRCEGHWNPIGHFLASNIVAQYLIEQELLPLAKEEKQKLLKKIRRNLNTSPKDILGEKAYNQIYSRGVYVGSSNISGILENEE